MKTQLQLVKEHLKKVGSITRIEADHLYRVASLTKVISKLKADGLNVKTIRKVDNTGRLYAKYTLSRGK